ncbi:RagB/SusD family nutrient uptake outer membrane protein [Chitinophaga oryziterrae]|uniref:RagB/SusD family nutrient uptake outer membrane protein n=1 Tax=Chitinophaga oryziterrae TaxID=1031224 RepID=A0A6N8JDG7_9BACT|nr:RagB/SusD family nutrient uptake outer membrane protein [Chitinophaga oryziterrae]MVT43375.1 RagB/SusD family nutrient uptake outer membrane protein [Chitinophaga oryziterrae]
MKYIKSIFILILLFSCNKNFLEKTDKTQLTDEIQWASEGNADIFLNDIYGSLPNYWNQPENLDNFTDDNDAGFYYTSNNWKQGIVAPSGTDYTVWGGITGSGDLTNWPAIFTAVRKCNTFMAEVQANAANFSPEWKQKRLDEARFLRTFFYSELWMHLGGLPLITNLPNRSDSNGLYYPRSTFAETVNFITSNLDTILLNGHLAVKYNHGEADAGRATLGAALALKGWVQLYAASPAYNAAQPAAGPDPLAGYNNYDGQRWTDAAATLKQFLDQYGNGHPYGLFPDLSALWYEANEYHAEVIWDRQVVPTTMGSSFEQYGGPVWINGAYYTWGNYDPTQELVDQFQMANGKSIQDPTSGYDPQHPYVGREPRFYDWIVYDGAPYKMAWMDKQDTIYTRIDKVHPSKNQIDFGTDDVSNTGYYFKKRLNPLVRPGGGTISGANFIYYRYAEILLGYAEAQNESAGPDASVYDAMHQIRARAGLPDLPAALSKDDMRTAIHQERRIELCFENKRFYDIIRWKTAENVLNLDRHGMKITNSVPADNSGVWVYEVVPLNHPHVFLQKMYLNPIPQDVMDRNPRIRQNPGY